MTLFKLSTSSQAYAKFGIYGEAGSGKTTTASLIAIGLHKFIKSTRPIAFMDTETGSDFVRPLFDKEGIQLQVAKTRSFESLLGIVPEAREIADILIIDSITHPYQDMLESYLKKTSKKKLAFQDWNILKPSFRRFTDAYVVETLHILICGRSQGIWDYFKDDDGAMQLHQIGTKMKVEKEMGYEPHILVEMDKIFREDKKGWTHRASILKDRNPDPTTSLDGKFFDDPTFENFLPHIKILNVGGEYEPVSLKDSQDVFDKEDGKPEWDKKREQKDIALEEIQNALVLAFPSTSGAEKKAKIHLLKHVFATGSWTAIEAMPLEELRAGKDAINAILSVDEAVANLLSDKPNLSSLNFENATGGA